MAGLYEPSNPLSMPFECFSYSSQCNPFPIKSHWHYFAELIVVRMGTVLISSDHVDYRVNPGEAFFVYPHTLHSIDAADGNEVTYDVIKLDVSHFTASSSYAPELCLVIEDVARRKLPSWFSVDVVKEMNLSESVAVCIREYRERMYGYDMVILSHLYNALYQMLRQWMKAGYEIHQQIFRSELFGSVTSITSYIEAHLHENLKVEDLAAYCRMSYPSFAKKFRELYGIPCKEYILQVRLARVEHFLLFTNFDLTYISQETGYVDCSHMIRDFKRYHGVTPGKFREEQGTNVIRIGKEQE